MRDYKAYINQAIASCQAAFFDQSIYLSQALRDQHIRNLRKYIDNDAATLQEEMELMDLIQLINDISATLQPPSALPALYWQAPPPLVASRQMKIYIPDTQIKPTLTRF